MVTECRDELEIIVTVKQVPDTTDVEVGEDGNLIREGVDSKMNPYDMYALETALQLKEKYGGNVTVLSMGPPQAEEVIREAFMMGADDGYLLTDIEFAGADTWATAYTLAQGLEVIGKRDAYDLIICGEESTDGDTAQVGPQIGEALSIPHVAYVSDILYEDTDTQKITIEKEMGDTIEVVEFPYPGLITVTKAVNQPRLPSFRLKLENKNKEITHLNFSDLPDNDSTNFGLDGSPTQVEKVFPPDDDIEQVIWEDESGEKMADRVYYELKKELKMV
ncbi:MAG: electron transfer flavoprotein subunit beta/FixA family protein [Halanaerobacter sp.]